MQQMPKIIKRYSTPSKLDMAPYGTYCITASMNESERLYKQMSKDESTPKWELIAEN